MQTGMTTGDAGAGLNAWWVSSLAQAGGETGGGAEIGAPAGGEIVLPGNPAQSGTPTQGTPTGAPVGTPQQAPGLFSGPFMFILLLFFLVMIVSSFMTQRRERRRREELLAGISKFDRVQTIGGIIGTVQEVRGDEVVLKVDENSNTRIRFAKSAIQQVLKSAGSPASGGEAAGGGEKTS